MSETNYIEPKKKLAEALDYNRFKAAALKRIEELASANWTDYNAHDPGITILEALTYALVDLGYRTEFDIKDILAYADGETPQPNTLFTGSEIFTTQPVTVKDYRKLFIDIKGVQNAWLQPFVSANPDFYIDRENEVLTHTPTELGVKLKGRYSIFLELENHPEWGDLNSPAMYYTIAQGNFVGVVLELRARFTNNLSDEIWQKGEIKNIVINNSVELDKGRYLFEISLKIKYLNKVNLYSGKAILMVNPKANMTFTQIKNVIKLNKPRSILHSWLARNQAITEVLKTVGKAYHGNRNLCEDLQNVQRAGLEEVAFCFDIEAESTADLEWLEAQIWYAIDKYLNPVVKFYTEEELREENYSTESIFDGPRLRGGFIKDDELENSEMRSKVYASDVINLIMDIEGVVNLTNFSMTKYGTWGTAISKNKKWEIDITPGHKPAFARSKSKVLFFKQNIPFVTRKPETIELFEGLKLGAASMRLTQTTNHNNLGGNPRELDKYISVVNELPRLYGVSPEGLPATVSDSRKNAAKQLKGYLLLFDQMLTNYLAHLNQFKNWISLDPTLHQSYFSQMVKGIRDDEELYVNKANYTASLPQWMEEEKESLHRRNAILDHLLARFNEEISEHNLALFFKNRSELSILKTGVENKIEYLKTYPLTSYKRVAAPNILQLEKQGGWLKKLFKQFGILENTAITIKPKYVKKVNAGVTSYTLKWVKRQGAAVIFTANKAIENLEELKFINQKLFNQWVLGSAKIKKAGSKWRVIIELEELTMRSALMTTKILAQEFLEEWDEELQVKSETGLMLENLLLRPLSMDYDFITDCIVPDICGAEDPYSFRATIVLPYWPENFRNMKYRRYIETTIRLQLPAHIMPKICWADWERYINLEDKLELWLNARSVQPWPIIMSNETNELIKAIKEVNSVYPEAILHDCEDDQDENPVVLNQTKLGNF